MKFLPLFLLFFVSGFGQRGDSLAVVRQVDSLIGECRKLSGDLDREKEALDLVSEATNLAFQQFGTGSILYVKCIYNKGRVFHGVGKFVEAESLYVESKRVFETAAFPKDKLYISIQGGLGNLYQSIGEFQKSESVLLNNSEIIKEVLGIKSAFYAVNQVSLGNLYFKLGDFLKTETYYLKAKEVRQEVLGKAHPDYGAILANLANLYSDMGRFGLAESMLLESVEIIKASLGTENPDYALCMNNLAILYMTMGEYEKAEMCFMEAMEIRGRTLGQEHPDFALSLSNLGAFYSETYDFVKAKPFFEKAFEIQSRVLGKESPDYSYTLNNLANTSMKLGKWENVESMYREVLNILEKFLGKEQPMYTLTLNNLANFFQIQGRLDESEKIYLENKLLRESIFGNSHPDYAWSLNNLASLYLDKFEFDKAADLLFDARRIWEKSAGPDHPDMTFVLTNLANLGRNINDLSLATSAHLENARLIKSLVKRHSEWNNDRRIIEFQKSFESGFNNFLSFTQTHPTDSLKTAAYDNALFFNNALLDAAIARENGIARADSATQVIHAQWKSCHFQLEKWYLKPIAERDSAIVAQLEEDANRHEKELVRRSAAFAESRREVRWQEVRDHLKPGQVAIEFINYRFHNARAVTDSTMYAALVLRPGDKAPAFVPLCEEQQIKAIVGKGLPQNTTDPRHYFSKTYGSPELYRLLWQPIEKQLLPGDTAIFFAPAGELHKINLDALHDSEGLPLADHYRFERLGSTRSLVSKKNSAQQIPPSGQRPSAIVYGGIDYAPDSLALASAAAKFRAVNLTGETWPLNQQRFPADSLLGGLDGAAKMKTRSGDFDHFQPLPFTLKEAKNVGSLLAKNGFQAETRTGFEACEEHFKQIGRSIAVPRVLHIATHGFFFPNPAGKTARQSLSAEKESVPFKIHEQPMMRGGLALAGANQMWREKRPFTGLEDGVLTAYELSHMNLSGTDLVVLSACETNLGDVAGTEGVYGLQRALKIAGAKHLIMSLWEVPDEQTQLLFDWFYRNWLENGMSISDAFHMAQKSLRERYPNPFFWGGFVLL